MKQNTKTNLTMILAAVFIMILVIVTLIPATDEVEIKEVDPGDKYDGMDAKKFKALSEAEQKEYLNYCSKVVRRFNYHQNIILNVLPEVVGVNYKDNITSTEEINEAPEPETTNEIQEEKSEVVQEQETVSDLDEKLKKLSKVEVPYNNDLLVISEWDAEILKERIEADEPTSLAILAERFGITEAEVLKLESDLTSFLESMPVDTKPQKTPSILDQKPALNIADVVPAKEQKADTEPEKTANEQAPEQAATQASEQAPEQETHAAVQADEQPEQANEQVNEQASEQNKQADSQEIEQKSGKKELGELEKECVLCGTIIPKYPHNVKICPDCKAEAVKANMLQRDYIAQELAKKGGNDED